MNFQTITASASPEVPNNENFETIDWTSVYGKRQPVTTGLTWGYYGGRWAGFAVSEGTLTLTDASTNYVVVQRSDGAISVSTSSTNWDNTSSYARVYKIVTSGGVVSGTPEDHRAGAGGIHSGDAAAGGSAGRHAVPVVASAMQPSITNGCAALTSAEISSSQPIVVYLAFDATSSESAQFSIPMPKSWNEGTVTFKAIWSHGSGGSSFSVVWSLQAVAVSNDDTIGASFGTEQSVVDVGGTANDLYVSPESSAITIAGTPAAEDVVFFRVARVADDSDDSLDLDARLHAVVVYITTDAETDA